MVTWWGLVPMYCTSDNVVVALASELVKFYDFA